MVANVLDRYRLLVLIGVALAARAATLGNPIVHVDEDFYFSAARVMWDSALPYVDVWDRKPVGLFLLYLLPAALPFAWGILAYQALALVAAVGAGWIVARLAALAGWAHGATLAGVAYVLWLNVAGGQGGQAPVFYNPLIAAAAWLIVGNGRRQWWRDAAAMLLVGFALQIKYSVVFEGVFFGLWIMIRDWRAGAGGARIAFRAVGLAAIALLPTAVAIGLYASAGQLDAFLFANFESITLRRIDPPRERWGNLAILMLLLSPLVAMAVDSVRRGLGGGSIERRFMLWWFAASLTGILVFGGWFDHYALPAYVPGSICAAGFFAARRRGAVVVLALVALIGQASVIASRIGRGDARAFAGVAAAIGDGPGCLWVYSGTTKLYSAVNRCQVTPFLFPSHLYRTREDGAIGVPQAAEVARILRTAPAVIVMRPPSIGERPEIRAMVTHVVARDYVAAARRPLGREMLTVYRRR